MWLWHLVHYYITHRADDMTIFMDAGGGGCGRSAAAAAASLVFKLLGQKMIVVLPKIGKNISVALAKRPGGFLCPARAKCIVLQSTRGYKTYKAVSLKVKNPFLYRKNSNLLHIAVNATLERGASVVIGV